MYYKAWMLTVTPGVSGKTDPHPLSGAYAESDDGIHWRKPQPGLHEFQESKANNLVFASDQVGTLTLDAGHLEVFKDENPRAATDARYKAIILAKLPAGRSGLIPFKSPDEMHWSPMSDRPVITDGAFDSQNLAFWDAVRGEYRAYWRADTQVEGRARGQRSIRTAASRDLIAWERQADVRFQDSLEEEQLYTNQIKPYARAPHLLVGFPLRYIDRGWSESMRALPEREHREYRASANPRFGTAITEGLLMTSRDGVAFRRWNEAFLPPGIEREGPQPKNVNGRGENGVCVHL